MTRGFVVSNLLRTRFLHFDSLGEATWGSVEQCAIFGTEERARMCAANKTKEKHRTRVIHQLTVGEALFVPVNEGDHIKEVPAWVERPENCK